MKFKSDSQRKAVFSRLNSLGNYCDVESHVFSRLASRFALKYDTKTGRVTSTEYPSVDFFLMTERPKETMRELEKLPEQHLLGLGGLVSNKLVSGIELEPEELASHFYGVPIYRVGKVGVRMPIISIKPTEEYFYEHQDDSDHEFGDVLAHELGHNIIRGTLGARELKRGGRGVHEIVADKFMHEYTGAKQRFKPMMGEEEDLERAHAYIETLQELKTPSIRQLVKYAGEEI